MGTAESSADKNKVLIFASGSASTGYHIQQATTDGRLPRTEVVGVIISDPKAGGSFRRNDLSLPPVRIIEVIPDEFPTKEEYGEALINAIKPFNPDVIGQYGHTPWTPKNTLEALADKFWINQHGAPLNPDQWDFGGVGMSCSARFHAARLMFVRATERNYWTDVTAQRVGVDFDAGPVLKRGRVPIHYSDTVESLTARAIKKEWRVQIETLADLEDGTVKELPPYQDLVLPGERLTLVLAKELAILAFTSHGEFRDPTISNLVNGNNKRLTAEAQRLLGFLNPATT